MEERGALRLAVLLLDPRREAQDLDLGGFHVYFTSSHFASTLPLCAHSLTLSLFCNYYYVHNHECQYTVNIAKIRRDVAIFAKGIYTLRCRRDEM